MGRARSKNPKKHQHCLRLTAEQEELLSRYTEFRGFNSEMDAVRAMIDGLGDWFVRQQAKLAAAAATSVTEGDTSVRPVAEAEYSGPPAEPAPSTDGVTSVGDFAGRPRVGLPDSHHDGQE